MYLVPSGITATKANPTLSGPAIGPVAGGFITAAGGIKWVFIAIACESLLSPQPPCASLSKTDHVQ